MHSISELLKMIDIYESWLFCKGEFANRTNDDNPPFGWDLVYYDDLCEYVVDIMKQQKQTP